jgi:D-alanyl-D-alanine dipeptidase
MNFSCCELSDAARAKGFVYLYEVDPTIIESPRYATAENFVGKPLPGYTCSRIVITMQAAQALKKVQDEVRQAGYSLVVWDAYRPQCAVDCFMQWSTDSADQVKKNSYYPFVNKADVFKLGYVDRRSGHSRGSTVDLTLIKIGKQLHAVQEKQCKLTNGQQMAFLDDGTLNMGSSFDMFDTVSHTYSDLVAATYTKRRLYLRSVMEKHGFRPYDKEWWHFTLINEPYPADQDSSYFNFTIS